MSKLFELKQNGEVQHLPVVYKIEPKDRYAKRRCQFEYQKLVKQIYDLESAFYEAVFSELTELYSYDEIYAHYLDKYHVLYKRIMSLNKPKWCLVNEYYFSDMFGSPEDVKAYSVAFGWDVKFRKKLIELA
jgi:hypothetical protein